MSKSCFMSKSQWYICESVALYPIQVPHGIEPFCSIPDKSEHFGGKSYNFYYLKMYFYVKN